MFIRHAVAMVIIIIGLVLGVILGITVSWQTGIIVGVIVCATGLLFAIFNLALAMKDITRFKGRHLW